MEFSNPHLAVEDVILGVVVGAVQHLVAHAALETPSVPLLPSGWKYFRIDVLRKYFTELFIHIEAGLLYSILC